MTSLKKIVTYEDALNFIHGRTQFKKIPTLKRMKKLMEKLGNPQNELQMIHVAGTNGKGSTVAFLQSLFMQQGLQVGTFTSPFLKRFNERISLNGKPIDDDELVKLTQAILPIIQQLDATLPEGGPTEFEIVTALMFMYFNQVQPDIVIVEVGIGGLFDSTNIISPLISVITTIGYDHMKLLGDTLPKIAAQKGGIIKPGVPVVIGELPEDANDTITKIAQQQNAKLYQPTIDYLVTKEELPKWGAQFKYSGIGLTSVEFTIDLLGDYQIDNAAVALTAFQLYCESHDFTPAINTMKKGLQMAYWAGRMERVNDQPLIILDGAHNLPAVTAIAQTIKTTFKHQEVYVLIAILADKQVHKMVATLAALKNVHLVVTPFAGPTKKRPGAISEQLLANQQPVNEIKTVNSWQAGLVQITQQMSADDILLITGSLYFISEVRPFFKD
ncbi:bifunctional folylpolyglutamate synthase/dihydrofolate synthase [Paucilactobacillus hokkaidonensis]|uniref:tetrahydrofolate synthase n=1 Tax=Paucilactobacillus hokkaidonensis TaxID=1193095 RepID=A0ABR5Q9E9_9LACO|nr:folylpolyglutamate synthase/dihydrofolate synthase family protein [Paucilactobacillus hokkaidonensis]KRO10548.1 dihydrofolate folylpolyglutamate synthetase [Paucilactobacillus hokkaidonensis]